MIFIIFVLSIYFYDHEKIIPYIIDIYFFECSRTN